MSGPDRHHAPWVADEDRPAPVRVLDGHSTQMGSVNELWLEFNTSQNSTGLSVA